MRETKIEWCDATFNPWWGCVKVSPGCAKCYAETFDRRAFGTSKHVTPAGEVREPHWGKDAHRRFFGEKHWRQPLAWDRAAENAMNAAEHGQAGGASGCLPHRPRVFCASMADVFEDRPDLVAERSRLACLIESTPNLDWLLLTKRPENVLRLWSWGFPPNVWLGTTCEDQQRADERIPHLLAVPAAVRFLSVEPMLGPVVLSPEAIGGYPESEEWARNGPNRDRIDWVIVGGESGAGARPFDVGWARDIVEQCRVAGVACFVKQFGARPFTENANLEDWPASVDFAPYPLEDGGRAAGASLKLADPKGGDPSEWPEDLRVREFPRGAS